MFDPSQSKPQSIQSILQNWIQIPALCQLCIEYAKLPLDQLWLFTVNQFIRFDPKTSQLFTYPHDSLLVSYHPTFASLWNGIDDFVFWGRHSLRFGNLLDGKLKTTEPDSIECLDRFQFSFLFQNQLYTIGKCRYIWSSPKEKKEIPLIRCKNDWGVAWIVHDEFVYRFGGYKCGRDRSLNTVRRYSLLSLAQTSLPCLLFTRAFSSATLHPESKCIFISGGVSNKETLNTIEIFDTKNQQFRGTPLLLPKPLYDHYSFCFRNFYFVVGGSSSVENNRDIWKHALTSEGTFVGDWIRVTSLSCSIGQSECLFG